MMKQKRSLFDARRLMALFAVVVFSLGIPAIEYAQAQECASQWVIDACNVGCETAFWTCDAGCVTCDAGCDIAFGTCDVGCATCDVGCEAAFGTCDAGCATCDAGCEAAFWTCDAGCNMCGVGEDLCKIGCSGVEGICGVTCDVGEGFCYVGCGTVFAGCVASIPVRCWPWDYDDCYTSCENNLNGCTAGCDIDCSYCVLNCEAGCEADCDVCQSACDNARGVCYTGCDTCQSGCDNARGVCYTGCDTCQSGCDNARGVCYTGCDTCQSGCDNARSVCYTGCDNCQSACDSARASCEAGCNSYNPCQKVGEWCQPTPGLPGECEAGLSCIPTFGLNQFNNNVFTCFPSDTDDVFPDDICRSFYSPDLHNIAINNNRLMSYGAGGAFGVLAGVSQEVGTFYSPDGSYGCYYSHCEGVSAGLELPLTINPSVCVGSDESIDAFHGQQLVATRDLSLGIMVSEIGPTVFNPDSTGSAICVGLDLPGFSVGIYNCHTVVDIVSLISPIDGEIVYITSNPPPVADPNGPYGGIVGAAVQFDGSASFDAVGTIVSYEWDFGDGTTGTGVNPTHTYALVGTYTVSLTVINNEDVADTATSFVTIEEEPCVDHTDCTDDNLCNGEETCENGTCMPGLPMICSDTDPCTDDSCDASDGCIFTPIPDCTSGVCADHIDCSDDNLCNGEETCLYEICMPGTPLICDDADPCTDDSCDAATGCVNAPIGDGGACDDADACTENDVCTEGSCAGTSVDCDDGETCTDDTCYPAIGCVNNPVLDGTPCDDGKFCTETSSCQEGFCEGSGNPCELLQLVCNEAEDGCECSEDEECDDGLYCNGEEVCEIKLNKQVCQPAIDDPCPQDHICDERKDACLTFQFCNTDDDCDDGLFCNGEEICFKGHGNVQGKSVAVSVCRQNTDPCTSADLCDEDNDVCLECIEDTDCDDGFFCNGHEMCIDGSCQEGISPCLPEEICDEESSACLGCVTDVDCNDELFCNGEEICLDGNCQSGTNPCSNEICDEENDVCLPQPLPLSFRLIPQSAFRSHLIPLPLFMTIVSDDTDFDSTTAVSFSDDILTPPLTLVLSPKLVFVFSMVTPVGLDNSEAVEVEVTVTTTEGEGTETLSLIPLPGILEN